MNVSNDRRRTATTVEDNSLLHTAAKYFIGDSYNDQSIEVLTIDSRTSIHWRKRSGIGLCAVAYVKSPGPGRGETIYLSNFRRMESGKGNARFQRKLIETLEISHRFETGVTDVPIEVVEKITSVLDQLMQSEKFQRFLKSGHKKADHHAATEYLRSHS